MGEPNTESMTADIVEDLFEPAVADLTEEMFKDVEAVSTGKHQLVEKRRLAEKRLEEKRLREELGDYDLEFDDF